MKNKLLGVFILLAVLLLAACNNDDEHENIIADYPVEIESSYIEADYSAENGNPKEVSSFEEQAEQAESDVDIFGAWVYVKTTIGDDDELLYIGEFTIIPPLINIHEDNTLSARFWGTTINGVVTAIGENEFILAEQTVTVYDEPVDSLDEVMLQYDVESGLLRWTRFNQFSGVYEHHFFARVNPFDTTLSEYAYIDGEFIAVHSEEWREFYPNNDAGQMTDVHPADFIGNWHDMPMVAAGFGDRYSFADDGTFIFASSEMDGTAREIAFSGSWEMVDGQVVLTIKNRLMLIGGNLVPASGSIGTDYEIVGGRVEYVRLPVEAFEVAIYEISDVVMDTVYGIGQIRFVWINGQAFWDFSHSGDLFDFYFINRDAVFPE